MVRDQPLAAAGSIFLAMALLAFLDSMVVFIARDLGLWQFHLFRSAIAITLVLAIAAFGLIRIRANRLWAVMLRGGCTAIAMLIYFGCLAFLPISQVAAGMFSSPIWILLINLVVFGRRTSWLLTLLAVTGFIGVLTVLDPFQESLNTIALAPLAAGLFYAVGNIATRQWCRGESAFAMLLWFFISLGLFGLLGSLYFTLFPHEVPVGTDGFILRGLVWGSETAWLLTIMQAVGSIGGVALVMRGYQLAEANFVGVFEYSLIVFAALWGWMIWSQQISLQEIIGILIILMSGAVSAITARAKSRHHRAA